MEVLCAGSNTAPSEEEEEEDVPVGINNPPIDTNVLHL